MNERALFGQPGAQTVDQTWKAITEAANAAFDKNDLSRAERLYDQALEAALRRFRTDRAAVSMANAPPMLVAAGANASECHSRRGQLMRAVTTTEETLASLRTAMLDASEHPAFRQACFHHLKPALLEYVGRTRAAGVAEATFQKTVLRTRDAALAFLSQHQTQH